MMTVGHIVGATIAQTVRGFFWGLGFIAAAALVVWVAEIARPMWV